MNKKKISKEQIESIKGFSRKIHETRLQALYVDFDTSAPILPIEAITESDAQNIIDLVSARLEMEKLREYGELKENMRGVSSA